MAFTVKSRYGENVQSAKDNETVAVQLVDVNGTLRLEARVFVETANYSGPTKVALSFATSEQVEAFAAALLTGAQELPDTVQAAPAAKQEAAVPVVPVKPVAGRGAAVRSRAKAARKAS